ncbi:helix-turn-helix domain-containing protein [Actinoplanes palleronii]|nr:helix-turn-helix transcriptional regulator [Actinoplanes palleronii]
MTIQLVPVRHAIAAEVRAEMARQNKSMRDLSPVLGIAHSGLALRVKGDVAFRGEELVVLAGALGVPVEQFLTVPLPIPSAA